MVVEIKAFDYENTQFIVLVNGIDEIGEHMCLADAINAAEMELVDWHGYSQVDAEEAVKNMIQDFL